MQGDIHTHSTPPRGIRVALVAVMAAMATVIGPSSALAALPIDAYKGAVLDANGAPDLRAGAHPHVASTFFRFPTTPNDDPVENVKDIVGSLPPGFVGNPKAVPRCPSDHVVGKFGQDPRPLCPPDSQVGVAHIYLAGFSFASMSELLGLPGLPIYNMEPPPGVPAQFGFQVLSVTVVMRGSLRDGDYGIDIVSPATSQGFGLVGVELDFWGNPASPLHDEARFGGHLCPVEPGIGPCPSNAPERPFLTTPTSCTGPQTTTLKVNSWQDPTAYSFASFDTMADHGNVPMETQGCEVLDFQPSMQIQPTTNSAETSAGLQVALDVPQSKQAEGRATAHVKRVEVTLPRGVTVNPSQAEGLGVCTPAGFAAESLESGPGEGCPSTSRIGSVEIDTPLLDKKIPGSVYLAQQDDPTTPQPGAENPFDSLLALYIVARSRETGVFVKLAGKVETDENTGRIVTTFDDLPQLPFEKFDLKFREGARAPLVTPPTCGTYDTQVEFVPWSAKDPDNPTEAEIVRKTSSFTIDRGVGGGPCPAGLPGFDPGFSAGTVNNNAKSFSPTLMRMTRRDGEQDLTKFSATLAPGLLAKLAGVENCPEAAIAAAKLKTGRAELAAPSCPAGSQIGRTLAGAGVGSVLTYVPGSLYLAGPYNGAPLSVVAITSAVAGPFDVGTVVVREALSLDRVTGVASVDGAASDPIPHILEGIPLKLRDLRVYVDRDEFTLNPTSCRPAAIGATLWGSGANVFSPADDQPVGRESRFQAANCLNLGLKPHLKINLRGGTQRGAHPGLRAVLRARPGDSNIRRTVVRLPSSAFLEQANIRTICTRVQWEQRACPKGSVYGRVAAFSPLLDEPLRGRAYLRSSNNQLPDLVFDLKGLVDIEASARIDSIRGGIRATFNGIPDAPLTKVVVNMAGGKRKSLIVNSTNLCRSTNRAQVRFDGHNGRVQNLRPVVRPNCKGRAKRSGKR